MNKNTNTNIMNADNKTFLFNHDSQETAYIIESYPYGRERTKKAIWIETNKKGEQREVYCTLNPKSNRWNNAKKSTYADAIYLYKDHSNNDFIKSYHFSFRYSNEEIKKYYDFIRENNLPISDKQKSTMKYVVQLYTATALNYTYNGYKPETLIKARQTVKENMKAIKENDFDNLFNGIQELPPQDIPETEQESPFRSTVYKGIENIMQGKAEPQPIKKDSIQVQIMNKNINTIEELNALLQQPEEPETIEPETPENPTREELSTATGLSTEQLRNYNRGKADSDRPQPEEPEQYNDHQKQQFTETQEPEVYAEEIYNMESLNLFN